MPSRLPTSLLIIATFLSSSCGAEEQWFLLQKVDGEAPQAALQSEAVDGLSIRVNWQSLEPRDDQWDWKYLDRQVENARRNGKRVMLRVMAGLSSPSHSYHSETSGIPTPWDPHHVAEFDEMISELGRRYAGPIVDVVHVPGFWHSAEMHLPKGFGRDREMTAAWNTRIASVKRAFPDQLIALNHSPESFSEDVLSQFQQITGERGAVQMNALKASTAVNWKGFYRILQAEKEGFSVGWQFIGPSTNRARFGGGFEQAVNKGRMAETSYWEFYAPDLDNVATVKK